MKNKTMRTFIIDGKEMQFNLTFFNNIFKTKARQDKKGIGELEEELATAIYVEKSTVHAWRNRVNGPSDIDKVEQIAEFFSMNKYDFLIEVEEMITYENIGKEDYRPITSIHFGDREKDSVKRVYQEMLNFMNRRIKYDRELQETVEKYIMDKILLDYTPEEEKDTPEFFYKEKENLFMCLETTKDEWFGVDFNVELEKVADVLEEEMVDMPNELYNIFETFISVLEITNSKDIDLGDNNEIPEDEEEYEAERIERTYIRNEKIISTLKENIRALLFQLKQ